MIRKVIPTFTAMGMVLGVTWTVDAAPMVQLGGLAGAEHWTWVEAEDATGGSGHTSFQDTTHVSGWFGNPDDYVEGTNPTNIKLKFTAPAALSNDTNLFIRGAIERDKSLDIHVDGSQVANPEVAGTSNSLPMHYFQLVGTNGDNAVSLGAVASGNHTLDIRRHGGYLAYWRYDGLLIYDGDPVLPSDTADIYGAGRYWLPHPASADSPEISGPVTPTFNIQGLDNNDQVHYQLDGAAYTPGTAIGVGEHELAVFVLNGPIGNTDRVAFSGANFTVVPEPASILLITMGVGLGLMTRPRGRASARRP